MKTIILAKILTVVGGIAMAVGALDPLEGSVLIFPGSALLALGTWLGGANRREVRSKVAAFVLLAIAFAALWGFSSVGGIGGTTGRSLWWGLLIVVPYVIGWNLGIWGPGSPKWLLWLGAVTGAVFLAMAASFATKHMNIASIFAAFGLIPLAGCIVRLKRTGNPTAAAA